MKLVVDAFGGDFAPKSILKGCLLAKSQYDNIEIVLAGNKKNIESAAKRYNIDISRFSILDAEGVISVEESPSNILKQKSRCSMAIAIKALNNSDISAFITAGSTGALAVGCGCFIKKIPGIKRAALCPTLPSYGGKFLLLDAGANLQCKEHTLLQFAIMGDIYAKKIFNIKNPRIGLANVGIETTKGTTYIKAAYELIKKYKNINFIGNVEARYIPLNVCDVVVCDGLVGNMILKTMEGTAKFLNRTLKDMYEKNIKTKIAALFLKKEHKLLKQKIDYKNYGGAIYLGFEKPIVKVHGNTNSKTFKNAILQTINCVQQNIIYDIENALKEDEQQKFKI